MMNIFEEEDDISKKYSELMEIMETRYGVLKVPEVNEEVEKNRFPLPILKFDDWGNDIV